VIHAWFPEPNYAFKDAFISTWFSIFSTVLPSIKSLPYLGFVQNFVQLLQVLLNVPTEVSQQLSFMSHIIWLEFLYLDPHRHDNRALYVSKILFQKSDGVILVLQPLCDRDKCVLCCLESILNVIGQGVDNHICSCMALSNVPTNIRNLELDMCKFESYQFNQSNLEPGALSSRMHVVFFLPSLLHSR
jgi:hypothetical protein